MAKQLGKVSRVRTLGLDIGPNSAGWALIEEDDGGTRLIDAGVRVFPEGVDNYGSTKQKSKNQDRRVARGQRRQIVRRKRRKQKLREALTRLGLMDIGSEAWAAALLTSPYALRAEGLNRKLQPAELARVLIHLSQRRGFLSNRKTDRSAKNEKEAKGMLGEISALDRELKAGGLTLGQYLAAREAKPGAIPLPANRLREKHTQRAMLFEEFERIWSKQAEFYPDVLNPQTRWGALGPRPALQPHKPRAIKKGADWLTAYGVEGIIFFQRPMFWPLEMVGRCEFEPREYRCTIADRSFQLFRILCDVNNLRYLHPRTKDATELTQVQRDAITAEFLRRESVSFDQMRKAAKLDANCRFTIEVGKKSKMGGHKTDHAMREAAKLANFDYEGLAEERKSALVRMIADPRIDDFALRQKISAEFGITDEQAGTLASAHLPGEHASVSLKAIDNILPHLRAGKVLMRSDEGDSALHAAGYARRDERGGELVSQLPGLDAIYSGPLADVPNPIVVAALHEVRKVVNLLVKTYGKPDRVHIELARDMKVGNKKRAEMEAFNSERMEQREAAAEEIKALGLRVSRDGIERYLLWKEQGGRCIYSGEMIGAAQLLGGEVDIDHLLPWSQSLDDSRMNKVVCFRACNQEKGQRTVHQWLAAGDPERYERVLQSARDLPLRKRERLKVEKVELDDFIKRQLVDTGYITRLATQYLGMLVGQKNVLGGKGKYTSELRWQWGLDTVLSDIPDSPAWQEVRKKAEAEEAKANECRGAGREEDAEEFSRNARRLLENGLGEKNRADHRHHAIDAIVVALTDQRRLQALSRIERQGGTRTTGEILEEPWPHFRRSVSEKIATVNVSHRVQRKVAGALHEDTQYAVVRQTDPELADEGSVFAVRKPLVSLTDAEIPRIRDRRIREMVQELLGTAGGRAKKGSKKEKPSKDEKQKRDAILANLKWPNGIPIRTVRITKPEKTIRAIRQSGQPAHVKPGSTHHLCVFEVELNGKTERDVVFVTMLEAARRVRDREPIIQRKHPTNPGARFLMSLSQGELVLLTFRGREALTTFKTAASTQGQIYFASHADGRKSADYSKLVCNGNTLDGKKVTVDPIGRIRWAND